LKVKIGNLALLFAMGPKWIVYIFEASHYIILSALFLEPHWQIPSDVVTSQTAYICKIGG